MDVKELLEELTGITGVSGNENNVSGYIRSVMEPYAKNIEIDALGNILVDIIPRQENKPYILLDAHMDQIGMIVTHINEEGFIRAAKCGAVDRRVMLAQTVTVHGSENIQGIVVSKPPHLESGNENKKSPDIDKILIDVGMDRNEAEKFISPGDIITVNGKFMNLKNGYISSPSLDDRAGVAAVILAGISVAENFSGFREQGFGLGLLFSVQEEVGERGAAVGGYKFSPDISISVDVSYGYTSDIDEHKSGKLGNGPMVGIAPTLDKEISKQFINSAKDNGIPFQLEVMSGETSTNADIIGVSGYGVKTGLLSIPLRYMHTPVEVICVKDVADAADLIVEFLNNIAKIPFSCHKNRNYQYLFNNKIPAVYEKQSEPAAQKKEENVFSPMEALLKSLCDADGISGFENNIRDVIVNEIKDYCEIETDNLGNITAFKRGRRNTGKKIMFCAHMDEVGMIITGVNADGRLYIDTVGGVDPRVIFGRSVRVGENGISGVIGSAPIHLLDASERENAVSKNKLFVDIGATSREDALKYVSLGDYVCFDGVFSALGKNFIKSKALDDRAGCALMIELIRSDLEYDAYFVFTVQEEVGLRGSKTAAYSVDPELAVILEATTAHDIPGTGEQDKVCILGKGPVIPFMDLRTIYDKDLYRLLFKTAEENGIPCQTKTKVAGGNDSGSIHTARGGIRTASISLPCRYLHTPSCVINPDDYYNALKLAKLLLNKLNV